MDTLELRSVTKATANVIKSIMKSHGTTKLELENATGIARTTLNRRLSNGDFTVAELEAISGALGTSPAWILTRAQKDIEQVSA